MYSTIHIQNWGPIKPKWTVQDIKDTISGKRGRKKNQKITAFVRAL